MLTTKDIQEIKRIYHDLSLTHKEVLKEVRKICGKKISYPTLLAFLKKEGIATRREMGSKA